MGQRPGFDKEMSATLYELREKAEEKKAIEKEVDLNLKAVTQAKVNKKVFIVHGHDDAAKYETARFLEKLGIEAIILHEQVGKGQAIIEKIEANADVGFAIILYTPCDEGRLKGSGELNPRARQNVVFEHGYFTARLERSRVAVLKKGEVETPGDMSGIVYIPMSGEDWKYKVADEMKAAGYDIDKNKI